ncbi:MAG: fumarylacetoacetate hydrolase family protein [Promethearchaeota archaeon]
MMKLPIFGSDKFMDLNPSKIIALGLNYQEHIAESHSVMIQGRTHEAPKEPVLFPKTPNVLIESGKNIIIPRFVSEYGFNDVKTDYEAELAIIIKDKCKNVKKEDAMNHIYGFTCFNDVSQRNIQTGDRSGWFRGKSFDTFGPIGPQVVLTEDIGDPQNLRIQGRVNGETKQDSNTKHMIFAIPETIAYISKNFTLMPGDIISTGTPKGVARIKHGDVVEVEIEKIGILRNPVIDEAL